MSGNQFVPNLKSIEKQTVSDGEELVKDSISDNLLSFAQYLILFSFVTVPLFFTVGSWATLGFSKVIFTTTIFSVAIIIVCLLGLRKSRIYSVAPVSLGLFWALVVAAFVSALFSGDVIDSIRGSFFEVQTVGFLAVLAIAMTLPLLLQRSKTKAIGAILLFGASSTVLILYNLLRFIFGTDFLSLGSFNSLTSSPIGGFNDLAIFAGLLVVLSLVTLVLLPLRMLIQYLISVAILISLIILAVINFFNIWVGVGLFSLILLVYLLSKDKLFKETDSSKRKNLPYLPIIMSAVVFLSSATFVVYGEQSSNMVNRFVNVDYVEVVPSFEGTLGIARSVYSESPWLGIGPNKFTDAWRIHKDRTINQTVFWDADFNSGSGFVPTLFINLGLVGGLIIIAFHVWFLVLGYRILLRSYQTDSHWYYISVISFSSACFVWGMSYVYEPGAAILIIGALFTGMTYAASGTMLPGTVKEVALITNQRRGFLVMSLVIMVIVAIIATLVSVVKQYSAQVNYNKAQSESVSIDVLTAEAQKSFSLFPDDRFMRSIAQIELVNLNNLLSIAEPTEENQKSFLASFEKSQGFIQQAINQDPTNPDNYAISAGIYRAVAIAGVDGAIEKSLSALNKAKGFDPVNPGYDLVSAQIATRIGDFDLAKTEIEKALLLKPDFTEALFLSAQIDINEGNVESAIQTTKAIISLEPRNPTRYFQLGVLLSASSKYEEAINAFATAVSFDQEFANARYMMALAQIAVGRSEDALIQLKIVRTNNPDNQQLLDLIKQVELGEDVVVPDLGFDTPVSESGIQSEDNIVTSSKNNETNLIDEVNPSRINSSEIETNEVISE